MLKRSMIWLISAAVALPVYVLTGVLGMPQLIVLITTFVGAMAGAVVGTLFIQRQQGQAGAATPADPRDRGSERKAR